MGVHDPRGVAEQAGGLVNAPYHPSHRVATLLVTTVHEAYDLWPEVESDDTIRNMARTAEWFFDALINGDPVRQKDLMDELDGLFTRIPRDPE